ncbi:MAG: hypothetical protein KA004_13705 [Verrucomicrobiales bacterium]|nr:hypothetical protein [Verrucomicrobiales bacterium]
MTLAEQLQQKGHREVHREGIQDAILANLRIRLGAVPDGLAEAVRAVRDDGRLDALQHVSLVCDSFDALAAAL